MWNVQNVFPLIRGNWSKGNIGRNNNNKGVMSQPGVGGSRGLTIYDNLQIWLFCGTRYPLCHNRVIIYVQPHVLNTDTDYIQQLQAMYKWPCHCCWQVKIHTFHLQTTLQHNLTNPLPVTPSCLSCHICHIGSGPEATLLYTVQHYCTASTWLQTELANKLPRHLKIPIQDCGKMLLNYPEEEYPLEPRLKIICVRR